MLAGFVRLMMLNFRYSKKHLLVLIFCELVIHMIFNYQNIMMHTYQKWKIEQHVEGKCLLKYTKYQMYQYTKGYHSINSYRLAMVPEFIDH